jgi:biotin transporter BioY
METIVPQTHSRFRHLPVLHFHFAIHFPSDSIPFTAQNAAAMAAAILVARSTP